jgi:hypothetical protein
MEARKSKRKVPADLVSSEGLFLTDGVSVHLHVVEEPGSSLDLF